MADEKTKQKPMVVVNGKEYPVVTDPSLGEMCDAETLFGVDFNDPKESARDVAATIYLAVRRVDPNVNVADIRAIPATELKEILKQLRGVDARPPDSAEKTSESTEPSSPDSSPIGEHDREQTPADSGDPASGNGSASDLAISGT